MSDLKIKESLSHAYRIDAPDQAAVDRIQSRIKQPAVKRKTRRIWLTVVGAAALCGISASAFPVVKANLFCFSLAQQMNPDMTCTLSLVVNGDRDHHQKIAMYQEIGRASCRERV